MTFTSEHVGFQNNGRNIIEYRLDGTPYIVVRQHPDTGVGGWSVYNEDRQFIEGDAHLLRDAKALAIRYAEAN